MDFILKQIELLLSGAGLLIIWSIPLMISGGHEDWKVTAIIATGVGTLHGVIFWTIRRRQRKVRNEVTAEVQLMLKDQINSMLTVINLSAEQAKRAEQHADRLKEVQEMTVKISHLHGGVSEESLQRWKDRFPNLFEKT